MKIVNKITVNSINYILLPDSEEDKKILQNPSNTQNCHNFCALAHMCKQLYETHDALLCKDVFLKDNVHFEVESICL